MAQLIVRNLSDDAKDGLKRRAERHGRSLEAEVRDILENASLEAAGAEVARKKQSRSHPAGREGLGTRIANRMKELGVTSEAVDELEENIRQLRREWRDRDVGLK